MTPVFERALGSAFDTLDACVRAVHRERGTRRYAGEVEVERGLHPLAALCAWATRLPPAGRGPIEVEIAAGAADERWSRRVGTHVMRSRLWERDGLLHERLGAVTFVFRLRAHAGAIEWTVERVRALGLPLPSRWFAAVGAREAACDGRYTFDVRAALPRVGLLVRYRGWLDVG
ncbi:DUF4166 domain-containing protein [Dokdonella sp.]|uniref:DUF4166 domain-containing protein n=1 Tax=Dokdonella sp. TaxID=2291710 RepID=UPI002F42043A